MKKSLNQKSMRGGFDPETVRRRRRGYRIGILLASTLLVILLMFLAAGYIYLKSIVKPPQPLAAAGHTVIAGSAAERPQEEDPFPDPGNDPDADPDAGQEDPLSGQEEIRIREDGRRENCFTMLVLGLDVSERLSDTIIAATFDLESKSAAVLNIPRDTLSSYKGGRIHKLNSAYGSGGVERTIAEVEAIIGYPIDRHVVITCDAFTALVDAIGGVDFNVPVNMYKVTDDMVIDLKAGMQHLDGKHALMYMRYRGYANADLARIEAQQGFYQAVIEKMAKPSTLLRLPALAKAVIDEVQTDMSLGEMLWLGINYCSMDTEDMIYNTLPNTPRYIGSAAYVIPREKAILELVNTYYNPFVSPITKLSLTAVPANTEPIKQDSEEGEDDVHFPLQELEEEEEEPDDAGPTDLPDVRDWDDLWEDWFSVDPDVEPDES